MSWVLQEATLQCTVLISSAVTRATEVPELNRIPFNKACNSGKLVKMLFKFDNLIGRMLGMLCSRC